MSGIQPGAVRTCVFDAYGTLFDTHQPHAAVLRA
jgi:FMN phosphatase YigB (HAD superfamily)